MVLRIRTPYKGEVNEVLRALFGSFSIEVVDDESDTYEGAAPHEQVPEYATKQDEPANPEAPGKKPINLERFRYEVCLTRVSYPDTDKDKWKWLGEIGKPAWQYTKSGFEKRMKDSSGLPLTTGDVVLVDYRTPCGTRHHGEYFVVHPDDEPDAYVMGIKGVSWTQGRDMLGWQVHKVKDWLEVFDEDYVVTDPDAGVTYDIAPHFIKKETV